MTDQPASDGALLLLSSNNDTLNGTSSADVIRGTVNQLTAADTVNGGGGVDTLQFTTAAAQLGPASLTGVTSVERFEFTGGGALGVTLDAHAVGQAAGDVLTLVFGASTLALNVSGVGDAGQVILEGTGLVTLNKAAGEVVTVADGFNGNVQGGLSDDTINGGTGADTFDGGDGDDNLYGNAGNDTLAGGLGDDYLDGGTGNDSLSGGAGYDLLVLGQNDTATGGADSDTFVIGADAASVTITDFTVSDGLEKIDLRAIATATSFDSLAISANGGNAKISIGGKTIILTGIAAADLSASNFVFAGQDNIITAAQNQSADVYFGVFTTNADVVTGTSGNDVFQSAGSIANLTSADIINGGGGIDTLRIVSATLSSFDTAKMAAYTSVEHLDLTSSYNVNPGTVITLTVDAHAVTQAGGVFTVYGGSNPFSLNVSDVGTAGTVVMATTGLVTLRNFDGQSVTIDDSVNGQVVGSTGADVIIGGAGNDTIAAGINDDNVWGGAGNDSLSGDDGNDYIDGGAGNDMLNGGTGYDLIVMNESDTATGGTGSDTFVVGANTAVVTITDFAAADPLEKIDLRAISSATDFSGLSISSSGGVTTVAVGGATIKLNGVNAAQLTSDDFVFAGQDSVVTAAQGLAADPTFILQPGTDNLTGGPNADIFQVTGDIARLTGTDQLHGGDGVDTLRIVNSDLSLSADRLAGLDSIEHLDLTASSFTAPNTSIALSLDAHAVTQAGGNLTVYGGINPFLLDVSSVGNAGSVTMATYGLVTLRNFQGESISIDDSVSGQVQGGTGADHITGGAGNDSFWGGDDADVLMGGAGNDVMHGDAHNDVITGGSGNDQLFGDDGLDTLISDGGSDTVTGGANSDTFVIQGSGSTTITDFAVSNLLERIDLRAYASVSDIDDLTITDTANGARFTIGGHTVTLNGVSAGSLTAGDFMFHGQSAAELNTFDVPAGTSEADRQQLLDEAPAGAVVRLGAGEFQISQTLFIHRSDITLQGAGSDKTTLVSLIDDSNASATLTIESEELRVKAADITTTGAAGATTLKLSSTAGLSVGSVIYISELNDDAFMAATGNTGLTLPDDYATNPQLYALREQITKITAINGNTITLAEPLPYTFEAGKATVAVDTPLSNVHVQDFQIVTTFPDVNPTDFVNRRDAWNSIPTVQFDTVTESTISDVAVHNPGSHAFRFQRVYDISGDHLFAEGAQNTGEDGNGYAFYFTEAFANTFTHLSDQDMRHSVLFSSFSAEHYNNIQVDSTNRDINFHGSPDSNNTVIVDSMIAAYGNTDQWPAVGPGHFPTHPYSTVDANTVLFHYLRSGDSDEVIHAVNTGADIDTGGGNDTVFGGDGDDLLAGGAGDDTVDGGKGNDVINGNAGNDVLIGGSGADSLNGGDDQDILDGGLGADTLNGGLGNDVIDLGDGDTGTGGGGFDTFVIAKASNVTITDFDTTTTLERIDLRAVSAATSFGALSVSDTANGAKITIGDTQIVLNGVAAVSVSAANFVFVGQSTITLAQSMTTKITGYLSSNADVLVGDSSSNVFEGSALQLSSADTINGGDGNDALRITGSSAAIDDTMLSGLTSVERINVSLLEPPVNLRISAANTAQAQGGVLTILGGDNDVTLDSRGVTLGKLVVETDGTVFLRNFDGEGVTLADSVSGTAVGGNGADKIDGGALADSISGGLNSDTLRGNGGDDVIDGGQGNDVMTGGAGRDTFFREFGDGSDTITDFAAGAGGDVIILNGYATNAFAKLVITASGTDTIIDLGQDGQILLKNVDPAILTAANFSFTAVNTLHNISAGAADDLVIGSDGDDVITIGASHVRDGLTVIGGAGINTVKVSAGSFSGTTADFGTYSGINALNFTSATSLALTVDQAMLNQAPGKALKLMIDDDTAAAIDVGAPTGGAKLLIDGSGTVTLSGSRSQVIYGSDTVGVNIFGTGGSDTITGGIQNDNLHGGNNVDKLFGQDGDDHLYGDAGADQLNGGNGNDWLDGGAAADTLTGGLGDDTYVVDTTADVIVEALNGGNDTIQTGLNGYALGANVENLTLAGTADINGSGNGMANVLTGNDGKNTLSGGAGNDTLVGGLGDDTLDGGVDGDTMSGGLGNDTYIVENAGDRVIELADEGTADTVKTNLASYTLTANVENLTLTGSANINGTGNELNNVILGNTGNNVLTGGAGDDILDGKEGADRMVGGAGNDTYSVENTGDVVVELAGEGTADTVKTNLLNYTLAANIENLILTGTGNVNGTGNELNNVITGNGLDNTLLGGKGDDILNGGNGNDILDGGTGFDRMNGGAGNDTYYYGSGDSIIEPENGGIDLVISNVVSMTLGYTLENITLGGAAAMNANGNGLNNVMIGNANANILQGGDGNDTIDGGAGNDTLNGGKGADILTGGLGNDIFVYRALADSTVAAPDRITDLGAGDILDLHLIDADVHHGGDQAFHQVAAFTGHEAEMTLIYDAGTNTTTLSVDANGDKKADFIILITGNHTDPTGWLL